MKKLIAAALLIVGMTAFAQEKPEGPKKGDRAAMAKLTPEQRSELHLKTLTLKLDLNASQQKEMGKIVAEMDAKREAMKAERIANKDKKLTSDEIFAKKNKMLDEKIAMKERLKKILNDEQMDKFEKMQQQRQKKMQEGKHNHRK
ncbi:MAG: hypothetical protein PSV16_14415 [Flavobacterium sp.]|nr:hypothetical protein [Flavobacterium sp.]